MDTCVRLVVRHSVLSKGTIVTTVLTCACMVFNAVFAATGVPAYLSVLVSTFGIIIAPVSFVLVLVTRSLEIRCHVNSEVTSWGGLFKILDVASLIISVAVIVALCIGWRPSMSSLANVPVRGSNDCTICFDAVDLNASNACLLHCGHVFHCQCIRKWVAVKASCPVCSASIDAGVCRELGSPIRYGIRGNALLRRLSPA